MSETRIKALQKSPLGKIPAEIRNKVYRLVFNSAIVHVKHVRTPGILRVCHLIRTEALPILFNNALFVINVGGAFGLTFDKEQFETDSSAFLRELPADTHFIKRAVSFDTFQSPYYVQPEEHIEAAHPEYTNYLSYKDDYSHLYVFELGKNPKVRHRIKPCPICDGPLSDYTYANRLNKHLEKGTVQYQKWADEHKAHVQEADRLLALEPYHGGLDVTKLEQFKLTTDMVHAMEEAEDAEEYIDWEIGCEELEEEWDREKKQREEDEVMWGERMVRLRRQWEELDRFLYPETEDEP